MKIHTALPPETWYKYIRDVISRFLLQTAENDPMRNMEPWRYRIEPYRKLIIQASGEETKPFRFTARADLSAWVRWNQLRDADIK